MRLPTFSNLYGRIFAIFWFTILLVLLGVMLLTHSDPRDIQAAQKNSINTLEKLAHEIEEHYAAAPSVEFALNRIYNQFGQGEKENRFGRRERFDQDGRFGDFDDIKIRVFITDQEGHLLGSHSRMPERAINNFVTSIDTFTAPQQRQYGRLLLIGPTPVTIARQPLLLFASTRNEPSPPFLLQLLDSPLKLMLVVMLISTPLLLWLAWALSQPARRLENAARRVANGEFVEDPSLEKGSAEFRAAGAAFNQMVTAVNGMISGNQRLLSDISHELRSPLTRLRMASALATRKQGESDELKRIELEAERLEKMIGELLQLSRMQINSHQQREAHSARELWQELLDDALFEAQQRQKQLSYSPLPECTLVGNPSLLMSAVENIIRNAIHYSRDQIQVSFQLQDKQLQIQVEDNGEGVPEAELEQIFRPFYRVSTARDRHSGGAGLGLAITESAVRQHNGTITAARSPLGGLSVTLTLPVQD